MKSLKYKIGLRDNSLLEGEARSIVIRDEQNILTLLNDAAPIITILLNGKALITTLDGSKTEYPYQQGFLRCQDNQCVIHVLK